MGRRPKGDRVLGPYPYRGRWRVQLVGGDGTRIDHYAETEAAAAAIGRALAAELQETGRTIGQALDEYETHLTEKGNRPQSVKLTIYRLGVVHEDREQPISWWTPKRAETRYEWMRARWSVSTHRGTLAEVRSWWRWMVRQRWIRVSPWEDVQPIGRPSHGKPQLRLDEARKLTRTALALARTGEQWERDGAIGVLMALLLGMRASEITQRLVRDVDDRGRLLWIPAAKTDAGRRVLEVPGVLRALLHARAKGRASEERLLGEHWRDWVSEWTRRLCERAGVPVVPAHGLRGTFASLATDAQAAGHVVAGQLGHESETTTRRSYTRREAQDRSQAARARLKILPGGRK